MVENYFSEVKKLFKLYYKHIVDLTLTLFITIIYIRLKIHLRFLILKGQNN